MTKLIDKSALVAEIEKYISNYKGILNKIDKSSDDWVESTLMTESKIDMCKEILSFLNTLEVKEVEEPNATDRGMAEEIIINLKRVEQDYHIDLTKEMEWLRSKT